MKVRSVDHKSYVTLEHKVDVAGYSAFEVMVHADLGHGRFDARNVDVQFQNLHAFVSDLDQFVLDRTRLPRLDGTYDTYLRFSATAGSVMLKYQLGDAVCGRGASHFAQSGGFEVEQESLLEFSEALRAIVRAHSDTFESRRSVAQFDSSQARRPYRASLRMPRWVVWSLGSLTVVQSILLFTFGFEGRGSAVSITMVFLTAALAAGWVDTLLTKVEMHQDVLTLRTLIGTRTIERKRIASVGWEVGVGVSLRLVDSRPVKLPYLGNSQQCANTIRAWLREVSETAR